MKASDNNHVYLGDQANDPLATADTVDGAAEEERAFAAAELDRTLQESALHGGSHVRRCRTRTLIKVKLRPTKHAVGIKLMKPALGLLRTLAGGAPRA